MLLSRCKSKNQLSGGQVFWQTLVTHFSFDDEMKKKREKQKEKNRNNNLESMER